MITVRYVNSIQNLNNIFSIVTINKRERDYIENTAYSAQDSTTNKRNKTHSSHRNFSS